MNRAKRRLVRPSALLGSTSSSLLVPTNALKRESEDYITGGILLFKEGEFSREQRWRIDKVCKVSVGSGFTEMPVAMRRGVGLFRGKFGGDAAARQEYDQHHGFWKVCCT